MLVRWVIQTRQPFTVVEHPAFRALIEATGATLPIKTADTLSNRIKEEFHSRRAYKKEELARSSQTLALSLDVWTSENQIAIMGIIGHWISPEFDRREKLLESTEIYGPHSGENLAEVVLRMLDELDIAPKLLTITGHNAATTGRSAIAYTTNSSRAKILKPFWDHTNSVSKACPTIVEDLSIYWSLDDLLNDVRNAEGDFEDVNIEIRDAMERGIQKMNKFARIMDDNLLYYVAPVLNQRIKSSLIVSQMSEQSSGVIVSQVREFLKKDYTPEPFVSCEVDHPRPAGMSETM
ncbi:uncharacterized protein N7483_002577 [Penicillium malachiteum]|uniref:uncharacterized protein n=1 Tax=Penicillium malachiteum TaxID=1324776 RepID=UPI002546D40C|nr:uncharacterized protein N7483_002577 [Penicillium malachiteum]KAJ5737452.1 hypothetical protein N7483_002577 [Penicillium malachiteum]